MESEAEMCEDPIRAEKNRRRKELRAWLKKMGPEEQAERSAALVGHLREHLLFSAGAEGLTVGIFYPLPGEPSLLALLRQAGVRWVFPRVEGETLSFYHVREPERGESWAAHLWGVTEPRPEAADLVSADEVQVLCVPGLGFDQHGHRLGRGAGYYDRWITERASAQMICVGVGWTEQVSERVPVEPHDARMHHLITDGGWIELE
jgi:5-formyltetrahydrofolate cyclo-ligase